MASSFALGCELRSIILRGVKRFRELEIVDQLRDALLLEARMLVAAAPEFDDDDIDGPTPEEIRQACDAIRADWSDRVLEERRWFRPDRIEHNREYHAEWREDNRKHLQEYHRSRKEHNKSLRQARSPERKAELLAYRCALYAKYAEQRREQQKAFREANRERMNARRRELRSRAKEAVCC